MVRVHDFPYLDHSDEDARAIGDNFGQYLGILNVGSPSVSQVLYVEVLINVEEPLKRGFFA